MFPSNGRPLAVADVNWSLPGAKSSASGLDASDNSNRATTRARTGCVRVSGTSTVRKYSSLLMRAARSLARSIATPGSGMGTGRRVSQ